MVKPDDTVSRVSYPAGSETLSMRRRSVYGTWEAPVGLWAKSLWSRTERHGNPGGDWEPGALSDLSGGMILG